MLLEEGTEDVELGFDPKFIFDAARASVGGD
jgi:hypothetical protein